MKKRKVTFKVSNIWKAKISTAIGAVAAIAVPIIASKLDTTTVTGSVIVAVLFALVGTKTETVKTEAEKAQETAKEYVEKIQVETNELKEAVNSLKKKSIYPKN